MSTIAFNQQTYKPGDPVEITINHGDTQQVVTFNVTGTITGPNATPEPATGSIAVTEDLPTSVQGVSDANKDAFQLISSGPGVTVFSGTAKATTPVTAQIADSAGNVVESVVATLSVQLPLVAQLIGFDCAPTDWVSTNNKIGPGMTHRIFYGGTTPLPTVFDPKGAPDGVTVIPSYKVQSTNVAAYIASIPANRPVIMIYHHEPENDYPFGSSFVSEFMAQSDIIRKAALARPDGGTNIRIAMCSLSYAYRAGGTASAIAGDFLRGLGNNSPNTGKPYADIFSTDVYQSSPTGAASKWPSNGLANYDRVQTWLGLATNPAIVGIVQQLGVQEYGMDYTSMTPSDFQARLTLDGNYLRSLNGTLQYPLAMWDYWYHSNAPGMQFADAASIALWQSIEQGTF